MESDNLAYMELAIHQAKLASESLEVPVGCVIIKDGEVIASGRNRTTETRNPAAATTHPSQPLSVAQLNPCNRQSVAQLASSAIGSQSRGSQAVQSIVSCAARKQQARRRRLTP
ncbi:hypothetical protein V6Z11_A04G000700 [Gossypium hirsutum]